MATNEQQLYDIVEKSFAAGNVQQAIAACRDLNVSYPEYADGWRIATSIHLQLKKPEAAFLSTEKVLALRPGDITSSLQRVESLLALERVEDAILALLGLARDANGNADEHDQIGRLMASIEMHDDALAQYEKAVTLQPDNPGLIYNVATAQRFLGMLDEAEANLDRVLQLNEFDFEAQAMRSSLRRQTAESNHVECLSRVLDDSRFPRRGEANVCYALAKEYDDLNDPEQSFRYLQRGAGARRRDMNYKVETDLEILAAITSTYSAEFFANNHYGDSSSEPIFIIGMPRTGTTLVERMLGEHTDVHSAGELDNFGREVMRQISEQEDLSQLSRTQVVEKGTEINFARLGREYVSSTRPATGQTLHFVDKLPFNYLYVGLIRVALPNAKIVNLTRHPMATCYAVYKQFFRDAYPFSYHMNDLARYFVAYHELITHWNDVLPGVIYSIAYEDVVADTEAEAIKLIRFCGLDWEPQILDFHKSEQASTTASATQVRKPVYRSSIDRWRDYKEFLAPLEQVLHDNKIDTN